MDPDHPDLCLMSVVNGTDYWARLVVTPRKGGFVDFRVVASAGAVAGAELCHGTIDPESVADLVTHMQENAK